MNPISGPPPIDPNLAVSLQGSQEALNALLPASPGPTAPSFGAPAYLSLSPSAQSLLGAPQTPSLDPSQQVTMTGLAATSAELSAFFPAAVTVPAPLPYSNAVPGATQTPGVPSLNPAYDPTHDPANPAYVGPPPAAPSSSNPAPAAATTATVPPYSYDPTQDPANPAYSGAGTPTPTAPSWSQDTANPSYWA